MSTTIVLNVKFILFFVFGQSDQKRKKKSAIFVYFVYKKSTFCLKIMLNLSFFGHFDKKRKNEKRDEPDNSSKVDFFLFVFWKN